jgi:hypothetical protein
VHYFLLACDYDETLADEGAVAPATLKALEQLASSRRRLVLARCRSTERGYVTQAASRLGDVAAAVKQLEAIASQRRSSWRFAVGGGTPPTGLVTGVHRVGLHHPRVGHPGNACHLRWPAPVARVLPERSRAIAIGGGSPVAILVEPLVGSVLAGTTRNFVQGGIVQGEQVGPFERIVRQVTTTYAPPMPIAVTTERRTRIGAASFKDRFDQRA